MFAKVENNQIVKYPYTSTDLQQDHPNTSFVMGETGTLNIFDNVTDLNALGVYAVKATTMPAYDPMKKIQEGTPVKINGEWVQFWEQTPLSAQEIESAKADKIARIKSKADSLTQNGGYPVVINGETKWFHSDTISRTQQLGLVLMGANIPADLQWKTMDGSFVPMTQALAQQIFAAAATQDIAIFNYSQELQLEVSTAANPFAVDIMTGWPATFTA